MSDDESPNKLSVQDMINHQQVKDEIIGCNKVTAYKAPKDEYARMDIKNVTSTKSGLKR